MVTSATFALVLTSVSLNALAQVLLRKGMTLGTLPAISEVVALGWALASNVWLWAGMGCYALSIGLWMIVLSRMPVSAAYPMLSIGYIIATVLGFAFLGEQVGTARIIGIALICVGVTVIGRGG